MIDELTSLGLTAGEARVYLSLLKAGPSKVGAVVRDSRVSYSKVYDVLERLAAKGLISHITIGKVRHFSAAEPYRLRDYIQRREEVLQNQKAVAGRIIPDLLKFAGTGKRNSAEIFVGLKGVRTAYEALLNGAGRGNTLRYFYPFDGYHEIASPFYQRLHLFQKQKKMEQRGIGTARFEKSKHYRELKGVNMRFVSFPLPGTIDIFGDRVLMVSWDSATAILVSAKEIADHFRQYFDSVWQVAR